MWSTGTVRFENGALLSVLNGLGYPDQGAGSNDQGINMFCEAPAASGGTGVSPVNPCGTLIRHDDQYRGVSHSYIDNTAGKHFGFINPDYFRLVPWEGDGLKPVGYGYDSIEANINAAIQIENATATLRADEATTQRKQLIEAIDERGLIATPANSAINELVVEAARLSITNDGARVGIQYGDGAGVTLI